MDFTNQVWPRPVGTGGAVERMRGPGACPGGQTRCQIATLSGGQVIGAGYPARKEAIHG